MYIYMYIYIYIYIYVYVILKKHTVSLKAQIFLFFNVKKSS